MDILGVCLKNGVSDDIHTSNISYEVHRAMFFLLFGRQGLFDMVIGCHKCEMNMAKGQVLGLL